MVTATPPKLTSTWSRAGRALHLCAGCDEPDHPQFLWKHSNADAGFGELGQTWSQPKVAMVKGYTNPVLIFAQDRRCAEDAERPQPTAWDAASFIWMPVTGALVWRAEPSAGAPPARPACARSPE